MSVNTQCNIITTLSPWAGNSLLKQVGLVFGGVAFLTGLSKIAIGFPIPMSFGTLAVMLIGLTYGLRLGVSTIFAYLALGLVAPVFAKPGFGLEYMLGTTGGFLAGYIALVVVVGYLADKGFTKSWLGTGLALMLGTVILFALGVAWLAYLIGSEKAIQFGLVPFVISEPIKILLAALIGKGVLKGVSRFTTL